MDYIFHLGHDDDVGVCSVIKEGFWGFWGVFIVTCYLFNVNLNGSAGVHACLKRWPCSLGGMFRCGCIGFGFQVFWKE